jgi:hypothetical protein
LVMIHKKFLTCKLYSVILCYYIDGDVIVIKKGF